MSGACVVRRLGRCASSSTPSPLPRCGGSRHTARAGRLRQVLPGRAGYGRGRDTQQRPFSTSTSNPRELWKLTPPGPPSSVNPHRPEAATTTITGGSGSGTSDLPEQLRSVMRLLPHSVVVCTSAHASDGTPRGMTMSSFTSLTLRPAPLVTFNVAVPSRTLDAVASSRRFNIHVLSGDVAGARVAEWFRRGNAPGVFGGESLREGCGCEIIGATTTTTTTTTTAPPLLKGPGVLCVLRCEVLEGATAGGGLVSVRDHMIVLGEVVDIVEGDGADFGLVYADRRYRQVGCGMVNEGE